MKSLDKKKTNSSPLTLEKSNDTFRQKPNIYRDIDGEFDKEFLDEFGDIRPKARPYEVKDFIHEKLDKQIDKTNREWEKGIQVIEKWLFVSEEERGYKRWSERGDVELAKMIINLLKHKEIK